MEVIFLIIICFLVGVLIKDQYNSTKRHNWRRNNSYYNYKTSNKKYSDQHKSKDFSYQNNNTYSTHTPQPHSNLAETNTSAKEAVAKQEYEFNYDYSYMPYRKKYLLTKTENSFFLILIRQALLRGLLVCPKVRLEDVAFVYDKKQERKYRGYVKSRHIDFVLINAKGDTIAGIELDDPSHDTEEAKKTDHFKDELFKTIKVPLIRIKTGTDYTAQLNTVFDNLNFTLVDQKKPLIVPDNVQTAKTAP